VVVGGTPGDEEEEGAPGGVDSGTDDCVDTASALGIEEDDEDEDEEEDDDDEEEVEEEKDASE